MQKYVQVYARNFRSCVSETDSVLDVEHCISETGIAVVIDSDGIFHGIVTEKDIAKNSKNGIPLLVADVCNQNPQTITVEELQNDANAGKNPFVGNLHSSMVVLDKNKFHSIIFDFILLLDIADACNLHCPGCPRGKREMANTQNKMSISSFEQIIVKAAKFGFSSIQLYNWTEPFLCNDLYAYISLAEKYGLMTHLSTNLSVPEIPHLSDVLYTGNGVIMVSVSGFTQAVHGIYHRGSDIEVVKNRLRYISSCYQKKPFARNVYVKFIDFGYNSKEISLFQSWIGTLPGIGFMVIKGMGDPLTGSTYYDQAFNSYELHGDRSKNGNNCECFRTIPVDCRGNTYLCCELPNQQRFQIGNLLNNDSLEDIIEAKRRSKFCQNCILPQTKYSH